MAGLLAGLVVLLWGAAPGAADCTAAQVEQIHAALGDLTAATACPEATWKAQFFAGPGVQGAAHRLVVYDIGCNKACDALATWQSLTLTPVNFTRWRERYQGSGLPGGVCGQCLGSPVPRRGASKPLRLYCVEPVPATFKAVYAGVAQLRLQAQGLVVLHGAFTSWDDAHARGWLARFPAGDSVRGAETLGLWGVGDAGGAREAVAEVPLYVLDQHVQQERVRHIDVLSIDTEGNDPLVLAGARRTLASRVRYVEFEYHSHGVWQTTALSAVVKELQSMGFVCYWLGKDRLWRITGCFHPAWDILKGWANVGCVKAADTEWYEIMEGIFRRTVQI